MTRRKRPTVEITSLTRFGWARVAVEPINLIEVKPITEESHPRSFALGARSYVRTGRWAGVCQEEPSEIERRKAEVTA